MSTHQLCFQNTRTCIVKNIIALSYDYKIHLKNFKVVSAFNCTHSTTYSIYTIFTNLIQELGILNHAAIFMQIICLNFAMH